MQPQQNSAGVRPSSISASDAQAMLKLRKELKEGTHIMPT